MQFRSRHSEPASDPPSTGAAGIALDLPRLMHMVWRRLWLLALCLGLCLGAGAWYASRLPKIYAGHAVVQVEQEAQQVTNIKNVNQEDLKAPELLKTIEQTLTSGSLYLRVVRANHLEKNRAFAPPRPGGSAYSDSELIDIMTSKVSVNLRRGTRLIDIIVEDPDPKLAAQLTQSLMDEYRQINLEQKLDVTKEANKFLVDEEVSLREKLKKSEELLNRYRAENLGDKGVGVSLSDKQNIVVEKLSDLSKKVTEAKGRRLQLEADISKMWPMEGKTVEQLLMLASINASPEVADLRRQINEKEGEFAAIKERYGWKHVKYQQAEGNLQKLKVALNAEVMKAASVLTRTYQSAQDAEQKLTAALRDQEQEALNLDKISIPYNDLARQVQSDRALYESVLIRLKETDVSKKGIEDSTIRVVEKPTVPYRPSKPSRLRILALAGLAGVALGTMFVLGLELFDHSLQTVDQAETTLRLPLLAAVPELRGRRRSPLLEAKDAPQREAIHALRTTLGMFVRGPTARTYLFTSAVPGEGKSFCSANFAASLAEQGLSTLLINADLRRPCSYDSLLSKAKLPGLSDCLLGKIPLAKAVHRTSAERLYICPTGNSRGNPADLLAGKRFTTVLREALKVFDRVVIDTPPLNAVSDGLIMAPHVAAVCLVVRARRTPRSAILRACKLLAMAGKEPIGFVFNRLPLGVGARYAYYYYGEEYHRLSESGAASTSS